MTVVGFKHEICQEVLIIDGFNVLNDHELHLFHELFASVTQTEKSFSKQEQELVSQAHHQQRV